MFLCSKAMPIIMALVTLVTASAAIAFAQSGTNAPEFNAQISREHSESASSGVLPEPENDRSTLTDAELQHLGFSRRMITPGDKWMIAYGYIHGITVVFMAPIALCFLVFRSVRRTGAYILGYYSGFYFGLLIAKFYSWQIIKMQFYFLDLNDSNQGSLDGVVELFNAVLTNATIYIPFWTFLFAILGVMLARRLTKRLSLAVPDVSVA